MQIKKVFYATKEALRKLRGRAARNVDGLVIFYADVMTESMQKTIDETGRRRKNRLLITFNIILLQPPLKKVRNRLWHRVRCWM
ncbi:MAG: hypothetical protein WDM90_15375 [Ferruginibacter sp.]